MYYVGERGVGIVNEYVNQADGGGQDIWDPCSLAAVGFVMFWGCNCDEVCQKCLALRL